MSHELQCIGMQFESMLLDFSIEEKTDKILWQNIISDGASDRVTKKYLISTHPFIDSSRAASVNDDRLNFQFNFSLYQHCVEKYLMLYMYEPRIGGFHVVCFNVKNICVRVQCGTIELHFSLFTLGIHVNSFTEPKRVCVVGREDRKIKLKRRSKKYIMYNTNKTHSSSSKMAILENRKQKKICNILKCAHIEYIKEVSNGTNVSNKILRH